MVENVLSLDDACGNGGGCSCSSPELKFSNRWGIGGGGGGVK